MRFIKKHISLFVGLTSIFIALAVLFTGGYVLADTYRSDLDSRLGTQSSKLQNDGEVGAKFKSTYTDTDSFVAAQKELAERIEEDGVVLLKNSETNGLPLTASGDINVTLFGIHSYSLRYGGTVNARPEPAQCVPVADAFNSRGFKVNPEMVNFYTSMSKKYEKGKASSSYEGATVNEIPQSEYSAAPSNYSSYNEAAIIFLGRDSAEGADYYPGAAGIKNASEFTTSDTGNIFSLSDDEKNLVQYVKERNVFKKIVVLLNTTSTIEIQPLKNDSSIDSIMWIGNPGAYGITGVADVLRGDVSPSGHLSDTYAVNTAKAPSAQNYGVYTYDNYLSLDPTAATGKYDLHNAWYMAQLEGIYTGYKYYETRYYDSVANPTSGASSSQGSSITGAWSYDTEVSYPFGYGLSYSTFTEEIIDTDIDFDGITTVKVKVTNTGKMAAKHAVQLYVSLPWTASNVEKSAIQLIGYAKTGDEKESKDNISFSEPVQLASNASEEVTITVPSHYFASYDENHGDGAFILDSGKYYFAVGNGAHDALQNVMRADGKLSDGIDVSKLVISETLAQQVVIDKSANGTTIKNQLKDTTDLKSLGVNVTYLSRNNWDSTFPATLTGLTATAKMQDYLANYTYKQSDYDASSIPTHTFGTSGVIGETPAAALVGKEFSDDLFDKVLNEIPLDTMVTQICKGFQLIAAVPEITMPDVHANGVTIGCGATLGKYNDKDSDYYVKPKDPNLDFSCNIFPLESVVASSFSHRIAELEGDMIGNQTLWTGLQWWYGVGGNLHRSPYNARNHDYYSEDPILSGVMGMDVIDATVPYGSIPGMKHFAFNTMESHRTGVSTFFNEQSARESELRSFQFAVEAGHVGSIMTAYNRTGVTFSSASKGLITGILRDEWGFKGITITDLVQTANGYVLPKESLVAGTDLIMTSSAKWDYFTTQSVSDDPVMRDAVYNAWHHIIYTVVNSNVFNLVNESSRVVRVFPWWEISIIVGLVISWTFMALSAAAVIVGALRKKGSEEVIS